MTDKKPQSEDTDPIQSERFRQVVRDLEAAGELSPTEADAALDNVLRRSAGRALGKAID